MLGLTLVCKMKPQRHFTCCNSNFKWSFSLTQVYKKLSYRKQIAHQLRTQYAEGIYSNSVTLKGVTQDHWKWHRSIDRMRVPISIL